jgi:oxaloacetate decarboxylase alpha subunit
MNEIDFVDTSFRDAQQSQWGEKMNTAMMYKIAPMMNLAGFRAMDATAISHFEFAVRYHRENPWERMRLLAEAIPSTPLSLMMLGNSLTIFKVTTGPIMALWMQRLAANGIRRVCPMAYALPRMLALKPWWHWSIHTVLFIPMSTTQNGLRMR